MNANLVKATWNTPLAKEFKTGFKQTDVCYVPLTPGTCGSMYQLEKDGLKTAIEKEDVKVLLEWYYRDSDGRLGGTLYNIFVEGTSSTKEEKERILDYLNTPQGSLLDFLVNYQENPQSTYVEIDGENQKVSAIVSMRDSLIVVHDGGNIVINHDEIWYIDEEDIGFGEGNYIVINA